MTRRRKPARRLAPPLYRHPAAPMMLVSRERRYLVTWPAVSGGWGQRRPYTGPEAELVAVDLSEAIDTGWHHARRHAYGPVPTGGVGRTVPRKLYLTPDEAARHDAARGDQPYSDFAREAIEQRIAGTAGGYK